MDGTDQWFTDPQSELSVRYAYRAYNYTICSINIPAVNVTRAPHYVTLVDYNITTRVIEAMLCHHSGVQPSPFLQ